MAGTLTDIFFHCNLGEDGLSLGQIEGLIFSKRIVPKENKYSLILELKHKYTNPDRILFWEGGF
jgi:hypothetical protein